MLARCVVLLLRCPGPLGSCSRVCALCALSCVCSVRGYLASAALCARSVRRVACAVSRAIWLPFIAVPALCSLLRVQCPGPLGSYSAGVLAPCVVMHVRCLWQLGSCSSMYMLGALCCLCGVLGHLGPGHRCACLIFCTNRVVFSADWLLFTSMLARRVVLRAQCLGFVAPVHRCARSVCCAVCCVCSVLGHLASFHRCARYMCCVAWAGRGSRARTRPSGRRLFVGGRGWVPSGCAHVHPDGSCFLAGRGWVRCPGAHASIQTAGVP